MKHNKDIIHCPVCGNIDSNYISRYYGTVYPFNKKYNNLLRCNKCGLVYLVPMPSEIQLDKFYSNYWTSDTAVQSSSEESLKIYKAENRSRLSFLLENLGNLENKTILDFGAGYGLFAEVLIEEGHNAKYYAVESDEKIVEYLISKGFRAAKKIDKLKQKEFDIIVAFHVLEHIPNPTKFIKLLISVLKENGLLFIEIPNQDYLWKKYFEPHVLFFNTNSLKVLLRKLSLCDFKIVSCGRRLQNIPKERTVKKLFRHQVGKILYSMGLKRPSLKKKNVIDEEKLRKLYKMDQFGQERQWLRAVIKK